MLARTNTIPAMRRIILLFPIPRGRPSARKQYPFRPEWPAALTKPLCPRAAAFEDPPAVFSVEPRPVLVAHPAGHQPQSTAPQLRDNGRVLIRAPDNTSREVPN